MAATPPYILWFRDLGPEARSLVGGKNLSLGEMMQAGLRVPAGFALTTHAYEHFLERAGLRRAIRASVASVDPRDPAAVERASLEVRGIIEGASLPEEVEGALREAYAVLAAETRDTAPPVAVRSSATGEDGAEASFAGQQETYLWVRGPEALVRHTVRCWSSLYTTQAISYRVRMGFALDAISMSVGIQRMVDASVAGVMFTLNPLNGDRSKTVIEASWGLGLSVVGGEVTPDEYWVDKVTLEVTKRTISPKDFQYVRDPVAGVARTAVPPHLRDVACLTDEEVIELARLGGAIEGRYGSPRDIEWAIDGRLPFPDRVLMLQSRPETVWANRRAEPLVRPRADPIEYVMDALLSRQRPGPG